jgi:hypothetical protein
MSQVDIQLITHLPPQVRVLEKEAFEKGLQVFDPTDCRMEFRGKLLQCSQSKKGTDLFCKQKRDEKIRHFRYLLIVRIPNSGL